MKQHMKKLLCLLLSAAMLFSLGAAAAAEEAQAPTRTILFYGIGSNLETSWGMLTWNLHQILEADIPANVNFLVMTGGALEWQTEKEYLEGADAVGKAQHNQLWLCSGKNAANAENGHGKMTLLDCPAELKNANMASEEALSRFITCGAELYPADLYDLILWDHGGGPVGGFGADDYFPDEDPISVPGIIRAIRSSAVERFEILDFDACLMSSVEVAAVLSECADYLVLSPETEPGYGQEYTTWMNLLAAEPAVGDYELGRCMVDAFHAFYTGEDSEGYGLEATLSLIDTKNFRDRLLPAVTELADTMNRELTEVGDKNLLLNFSDELRTWASAYAFSDASLLDLGNFAEHLGICMSELDNAENLSSMTNAYTDTAAAIKTALADQDGSGDDVIYARASDLMTKAIPARVSYTRGEDGNLVRAAEASPTGLSFFLNLSEQDAIGSYVLVMEELYELSADEDVQAMLRSLETAAIRLFLLESCGNTVAELREAGEKNVYYKTVRDQWQTERELKSYEIDAYKQIAGIPESVNITGLSSSDWNACYSRLIETLDAHSPVDTETWLSLVAAQQSSEGIVSDRAGAVAVDKNADGTVDAYRIQVPGPMGLVKNVSLQVLMPPVEERPEDVQDFFEIGANAIVGNLYGSPAMEGALNVRADWSGLADMLSSLYTAESCVYEVPFLVDSWYEIVDSEGVGHLVCLGDVDPSLSRDLRLPVTVTLANPDEDGDAVTMDGFLLYSGGSFTAFQEDSFGSPAIPLSNEAFDGATLVPCERIVVDLFGMALPLYDPLSGGFTLPADSGADRGMSLRMTPISDIADLKGQSPEFRCVITDVYGYTHDVSAAVAAADEAGTVLTSLETAQITIPGQWDEDYMPVVQVLLNGQELEPGVDYRVAVDPVNWFTPECIYVFGIGDYVGYVQVPYNEADMDAMD